MNIKSFAVLVSGAEGLIPQFYPNVQTWVTAVGTELIQNHVVDSVRTKKQQVGEVWNDLGGSEMARHCLHKGCPIEAVVGTLFLAGELAAVSKPPLPADMAQDLVLFCDRAPIRGMVYFASKSLYELRNARRDLGNELIIKRVMEFTPLANLSLVCGSQITAVSSIAQVLIKSVVQRNLGTFQSSAHAFPEGDFLRVIHDYPREQLIAGAAATNHLQSYYERIFESGMFRESNGLYTLTPVNLDASNKEGTEKYFMAGRALGLSILYGVPIGRRLDPNFVELLCDQAADKMMLESMVVQYGFRDVIPHTVLRQLNIESKTVGDILRGMQEFHVTTVMLQKHMRLNLQESQLVELLNALGQELEYPNLLVRFATGITHMPVGGLVSIVPPIRIRIAPSANGVSVNREKHSVTLPNRDFGSQLISALTAAAL